MLGWLDDRLGTASWARTGLRKVFPDHWSFLLGEVALFCLVVLVLTGVFLTLFYVPDATQVTYTGPWQPLDGQQVSAAFDSVMRLSFEVRAGLVMRQIHHWAALVFLAAIVIHMLRIFLTGAFRKPREVNWLVGISLLLLALAMGITGYSLPDDLLSGTGLRVIYSVVISIPFIGPYLAFLIFGGEFPTPEIISRLFVFHVMLFPALLIGGVLTHLVILVRQKHAQYRGPLATEHNVVGRAFWPAQAFRSTALMILVAAVLALMGGLIQINPIWTYGPFDATTVSAPAQPDWYAGWLDGGLRLFPSFEPTILGVTLPAPFIPGVLFPGAAFTVLALWPFLEAWVARDRAEHQLLDGLRDNPLRTGLGVAGLLVFVILTLAGGNDVLTVVLGVPLEAMTNLLRVALVAVPVVGFLVTYRVCRELQRGGGGPPLVRGPALRLRRTASGGFEEAEAGDPETS